MKTTTAKRKEVASIALSNRLWNVLLFGFTTIKYIHENLHGSTIRLHLKKEFSFKILVMFKPIVVCFIVDSVEANCKRGPWINDYNAKDQSCFRHHRMDFREVYAVGRIFSVVCHAVTRGIGNYERFLRPKSDNWISHWRIFLHPIQAISKFYLNY